jgi:hypothetical protein
MANIMTLEMDCYTDCLRGYRQRTFRHTLAAGEELLLLVNGTDTAFSRAYQPVIDLINDCVTETMSRQNEGIVNRLRLAQATVKREMLRRFPSGEELLDEYYSASFVAVIVSDNQYYAGWVGSEQARVYRQGRCVKATTPHVVEMRTPLGRKLLYSDNVIRAREGECLGNMEIIGPETLERGDVVLMANYKVFTMGSEELVLSRVLNAAGAPARDLVEWAQSVSFEFAQAAIVVKA